MTNKMQFSDPSAEAGFEKMNLSTKWLAVEMHLWALDQGVQLTFTATWSSPEEDKKLGRVSDTHRTGRAFDIRTRDLSPEFIEKFQEHFNSLYKNSMGAVNKDGPCLIVFKPHGTGPHFHVQIRRDYESRRKS
jgi:hypothetical protein